MLPATPCPGVCGWPVAFFLQQQLSPVAPTETFEQSLRYIPYDPSQKKASQAVSWSEGGKNDSAPAPFL